MFIVGQRVRETAEVPEFHFDVVGSTGNIYNVKIGKLPSCDCPDGKFRGRGECKHIVYGMSSTLNSIYSLPSAFSSHLIITIILTDNLLSSPPQSS